VHLLGQESLLQAHKEGSTLVLPNHIGATVANLTSNRFAQQFSDLYQQAVKDSMNREMLLRTLAKWNSRDIPTSEVYPVAKDLGVSNPSICRRQLSADAGGRVLVTPAFQDRGVVRFRNEMFKIYVRLRPSIYQGVDRIVDAAWKEAHPS
jgi:hypothetical protein